jgi:hypothetical protein
MQEKKRYVKLEKLNRFRFAGNVVYISRGDFSQNRIEMRLPKSRSAEAQAESRQLFLPNRNGGGVKPN